MDIRTALKSTMTEFALTGDALAEASKFTPSRLSRFLNGGEIKTEGLDSLLDALNDDVFQHLIENIVGDRGFYIVKKAPPSPIDLVDKLNPEELADLLRAISKKVETAQIPKTI